MKLYYAPGACSLADHIALHEAGATFEREAVDLKAKRTASGADYTAINPKGYVPALVLDDGELLTENVAILDWIATQHGTLMPGGALGRSRLIEALAYISSELHGGFKPFFTGGDDAALAAARTALSRRFDYLGERLSGDYLFGAEPSTADFYLFVMLLWAQKRDVPVGAALAAFRDRVGARDAARLAMAHEG